MESDESTDLVDAEAVNAYWSVVAKEEHENPYKYSEEGKMLIDHDFIHTSIFFRWSLLSLLNRTKGQLKFLPRGEELALERVVEVVVHAKQQITIVTQTVSVADVPAMKGPNVRRPDTAWKQLNAWQADIFPYFSSKSKTFIRKCSTFIYNPQALPCSPKFRTSYFSPYSHPSAWDLGTFQWHGRTRSFDNSILLSEIYQFS